VVRERACHTPNQAVTTKAERISPSFTEQSPGQGGGVVLVYPP
jgi:hypothetical protein